MKMKKLATFALAAAFTIGTFGISVPVKAAENSTDYTITIPATLTVEQKGWNATDGIKAQVKSGDTFDSGKKLTVTAASTNNWALKSGNNSVGYNLATATGTYSSTAEPASWEFSAADLNADGGKTNPMGIIVEDYSSKPAGTYQDTVTFTAKVENTIRTVTFNTTVDGTTINKDGITCSVSFNTSMNMTAGGTFTTATGKFTKIVVKSSYVGYIKKDKNNNPIPGWTVSDLQTATWTGSASSVNFGPIWGDSKPVTIEFTVE